MKKPPFEDELLRALQSQMQGPPQAAARVRVSKRLEGTFIGLDLGLANLASLPSSAPVLKAAGVKVSAATAKAASVPLGAAKSLGVAAPAISMSTHPIATLIATFAVGAVAGTGIMVASEALPQSTTSSAQSARASTAASAHVRRPPGPVVPTRSPLAAAVESATPAMALEPTPSLPPAVLSHEAVLAHKATPSLPVRAARTFRPALAVSKPPSSGTSPVARSAATESLADALGAQQSLLDRAREALAHGNGEGALSLLAQHERAFASTVLEEERASLKIKSLMASGRVTEARTLAAGFEAHFPHSLLLPSIRAAVAKNP